MSSDAETERLRSLLASLGGSAAAEPSAADAFAADPALEGLVQEFAERMARSAAPGATTVHPKPGFVVKTRLSAPFENLQASTRVFLNICHSEDVPQPIHISDEDVDKALAALANADGDQAASVPFKVPMGVSQPRTDKSKSGDTCLVSDAVFHSSVVSRARQNNKFRSFICGLVTGYLFHKFNLSTIDELVMLNISAKGQLQPITIRASRTPVISDLGQPNPPIRHAAAKKPPMIAETNIKPTIPAPSYNISLHPKSEQPQFIIVDISMPATASSSSIELDLEPKRLLLLDPTRYKLNVSLPAAIDTDRISAQFNRDKRILSVAAPLALKS